MSEDRLESAAKSLGMSPVPESVEVLRKEIRTELSDLHPDRNDGDFSDGEASERFAKLSSVLAELDSDGAATALVPVATVAPMVSAIIDALGQVGQFHPHGASSATQRQALRLEARDEARHRFRLSRLGSGFIATFVSGLWVLPTVTAAWGNDNVSAAIEASIVAPLFAYSLFEPITFSIALYAWMFFALTWFMEQNDLTRIDWITTDECRGLLLKRAVLAARQRGDLETITRSDLRDALGHGLKPSFILRLFGARDVSDSFLDRVVSQHTQELTAQRVLTPAEEASLSPRYVVAESVLQDVKP